MGFNLNEGCFKKLAKNNTYLLPLNLLGELIIITLCLRFGYNNYTSVDVFAFSLITWMIGSFLSKSYYINRKPGVLINSFNLTKLYLIYFLIHFFYVEIFHPNTYDHILSINLGVLTYLALVSWRFIIFLIQKNKLRYSKEKTNAVIVGISVNSIHFKEFIEKRSEYGINILGFFSDKPNEKVNYLGSKDELFPYCKSNNVEEIICASDKVSNERLNSIIEFAENNLIKVKILPETGVLTGGNFDLNYLEHIPLLDIKKNPFDEVSNQYLKRLFDIIFSSLVIIFILSWLLPILALLIKLNSKGPVFFIQERTGLRNNTFKCFKLRSMKVNDLSNLKQAQKNDPRITKLGSFLRKTSLDELPQFFNVLIGNMSVVGPRPHMVKHTEEYSQLVDKYMLRHLVKPGITGLSQVMGYRGETQHDLYLMKMRVRMDRFYIENWSFYLDLKIIYLTVLSMFRKNQYAY